MVFFLVIMAGYLLGSISFGIIVANKVKGIDIREHGSGNTGMTNILRVLGRGPAAIVLLGDALKGIAATAPGLYLDNPSYAVAGGLAAMFGHTYPLFHSFKGGKGVATGLGIILVLAPEVTLIAIIVFVISVYISRYISLGSVLAALSVAINMAIFHKPLPVILFGLLGASFVIYRHKSNIKRLYEGKENKIGQK